MLVPGSGADLARHVASLVHSDHKFEAAEEVNSFCRLGLKLDNAPDKYMPVLQHWLHYLLNNHAPEEAAQLLWTPTKFTPEPKFTKDLWSMFDSSNQGLVMGAASASKSYGLGVRYFLEWIRDPANTTIRVVGPSEDHLEANLFSHLVDLHTSASLPMPGEVGELFIGLSRRNQLSSIKGTIIPKGEKKKAGRLQGVKRKARANPHPIFGPLTRYFIFIDEIENVPGGIWGDLDNVLSQVEEDGIVEGFKIFAAYNPKDITNEVAKRAEPPFGWQSFDVETHYRWKSQRGWDVIRLDGEKSENVLSGKVIFPGLQTKAGLEAIARNAGGRNSPGYLSMGRGAYPILGIELQIIPSGMLGKLRGEFIWYDDPTPISAADLALEGGDAIIYTLGKFGKATGIKYPPSIEHPQGRKLMFRDRSGNTIIRWGLQADQQFSVEKGDTVAVKTRLIELNRKAGVKPNFFCCDRTGVGAGIADLMKNEWGADLHDVNFSEACSKEKLMLEDTKTCAESYERMNSELPFALRSWGEFYYLLLNPALDLSKLTPQMTERRFRTSGGKSRVESKKDYMSRSQNNESPNEFDSLTLLVHAARKGSGIIPSMKLDESADMPGGGSEDDWPQPGTNYAGGVRIDPSNRTDYLDDRFSRE